MCSASWDPHPYPASMGMCVINDLYTGSREGVFTGDGHVQLAEDLCCSPILFCVTGGGHIQLAGDMCYSPILRARDVCQWCGHTQLAGDVCHWWWTHTASRGCVSLVVDTHS